MHKIFNDKKKRIIAIFILLIGIILISFLYYKFYSIYHIGIPCIFHKITGLYCPGCGITRALFALFELDLKKALQYNILIFIIGPFLLYYFIKKTYNWILSKEEKKILPNILVYLILIITILFGILRNIEWFEFLRPII